MPSLRRPVAFQFINSAGPEDATSRDNIRQIRSHAAKEIRHRRRNSVKKVKEVGDGLKNADISTPIIAIRKVSLNLKHHKAKRQPTGQLEFENHDREAAASDLLPKLNQEVNAGVLPESVGWRAARDLTDAEMLLLDHCALTINPVSSNLGHSNPARTRRVLHYSVHERRMSQKQRRLKSTLYRHAVEALAPFRSVRLGPSSSALSPGLS